MILGCVICLCGFFFVLCFIFISVLFRSQSVTQASSLQLYSWAVHMHEGKIKQKPQQSVALLSKGQKASDGKAPGQRQGRDEAQVSGPLLLLDACVGLGDPVISLCLNFLICRIIS